MTSEKICNFLQKWMPTLRGLAGIFALTVIPLAVAFVPSCVQERMAKASRKEDYVGIAVSVLGKENKPDTNVALRQWAVRLLGKDSPVPLTKSLKKDLVNGTTNLGRVRFAWTSGSGLTTELSDVAAGLGAVGLVANLHKPECAIARVQGRRVQLLKPVPCPTTKAPSGKGR